MAEWDAEIEVSPEMALGLIREQFPALGRTIERFGRGWDNEAYLVDGELVFRFPRRSMAVPLLATESRVLPRIAPHLPLAIPCPEWVGEPTERYPWPFAGYRRIGGHAVASLELSPEDRRAAGEPIAAFLRALHDIPTHGLDLPGDEFQRTNLERRIPRLRDDLRELADAGIIANGEPWIRLFDGGVPAPTSDPVLVHGDLYELHILVDDAHRPCGVIDWGDVHRGDPAIDLSILYRFFPAAMRADVLRVYGDVDARTARLARLRGAYHAVIVARFAHSTGNASLLRTARTAMDFVLED